MANGQPTIYDVARLAGVSPATVSRALGSGSSSPATRRLVRDAASKLGFRANLIARALNTGNTRSVGFIVPDLTNPIFSAILRAAEREAGLHGYTMVLVDTDEDQHAERQAAERLGRVADGIILVTPRDNDGQIQNLAARIPVVCVNRHIDGVESVVVDVEPGTTAALEHLVELGHQHVVFVPGPANSWLMQQRIAIIERESARLGLRLTLLPAGLGELERGELVAADVLATGATVVLCLNDLVAFGLMIGLRRLGVDLPEEMSLVGYEDILGPTFSEPTLTSIALPAADLGRVAATVMLAKLQGTDAPAPERLEATLNVRASTVPPAAYQAGSALHR